MSVDVQTAAALDLARECLYRFFAAGLSDPCGDRFPLALDADNLNLACAAADLLREEALETPGRLGFGELPPEALSADDLCACLQDPRADLQAEYDRAFGLVGRACPPYETEYYSSSEPFFRSQQLADVAGFYRAFGLTPSQRTPERPDHVTLELEFLALVLMKKRRAGESAGTDREAAQYVGVCEHAERSFFRDHLAWWLPSFATGLRRKAEDGYCAALGRLLAAFVPVERRRLGVDPPRMPVEAAVAEKPDEEPECAGCTGPA